MKRMTIILTALVLSLGLSQTAQAAGKGPQAFLQSIDKKMKPLLVKADKNHAKILKLVNQMLDFDKLCKDSLGKHWDERSEAERKEFSDTLKALIEKNVIARLKNTNSNNISYESEEVKGNKATVTTIVRDGDGPRAAEVEIAYKMEKKAGKWIVVDMDTDGISLVSNYRSQFNKLIKKDGWDAMIQKMKDKLAE